MVSLAPRNGPAALGIMEKPMSGKWKVDDRNSLFSVKKKER
jgi:hypothetical protein